MKKFLNIGLSILMVISLAVATAKANEDPNRLFGVLSDTVVTPHTKWAKPYYKGKLKALVIAPMWTQRETVELAQRISLSYVPVMTIDYVHLGTEPSDSKTYYDYRIPATRTTYVSDCLSSGLEKDYDVVIIGGFKWESLPLKSRYAILKKVHDGTGLIYVSPHGETANLKKALSNKVSDEERFITTGIPFTMLPAFKDYKSKQDTIESVISTSQFGKGRIAILNYEVGGGTRMWRSFVIGKCNSLTPVNSSNEELTPLQYEYYHSLLAKAVLWAGKKEPYLYIKELLPVKEELNIGESIKINIKLLSKSEEVKEIKLTYTIRNENNMVELAGDKILRIHSGINTFSIDLPQLKAGLHFIDIHLKEGLKIINWGSIYLRVNSDLKMEIALDKDYYKKGESIEGKIVFNLPVDKKRVRLQLIDSYQRLIAEKHFNIEGKKEIDFRFELDYPLSILMQLKANLYDENNNLLQETIKEITVADESSSDEFMFSLWGSLPLNYLGNLLPALYSRYSVDGCHPFAIGHSAESNRLQAKKFAKGNLKPCPYLARFYGESAKDGIRGPCLTNPGYRQNVAKKLRRDTKIFSPYSPLYYSLGDENFLSLSQDVCFSSTCQEDFRRYLKNEYTTLKALNEEWGTNYTDWKEVKPITLKEAKETEKFAQWADHRMHMEEVFTDIHAFSKEIIQEIDPSAKVGFDGPYDTSSYTGYDWWRLMKVFDMCIGYYSRPLENELIRSFAKEGTFLGNWAGGYLWERKESICRHSPWFNLFNNFNAVTFYSLIGPEGALTPDLSPQPYFSWFLEETIDMKEGIGKLLLNSQRQTDGIAIHYSPACVHASTIRTGGPAMWRNSAKNFTLLIEDLGMQYNFLYYKDIEKGKLIKEGYKVLVLPCALALSKEEVKAIKRFVKKGGILIADYVPGIMDEHCKQLLESSLAELFGISGTSGVVNSYGRGNAVCLDNLLRSYDSERDYSPGDKTRRKVLKILEKANVKPRINILISEGKVLKKDIEVVFFKNGSIEYAGLLKNPQAKEQSPEDVIVVFPYKSYLYDVREKKFYGYIDRLNTTILPGRAKLFALLPYKVEEINLSLGKKEYKQGEILSFSLSVKVSQGKPCAHVVRMEVFNPEGQPLQYYSKNIIVKEGTQLVKIPLALNEEKGEYRIRLEDVVSGKKVEKQFVVK